MEETVFKLSDILTAGFAGSIITLIIKAIIDAILAGRVHKRELSKEIFKRKTDAAEKAMSWYQESIDNYTLTQQACDAFGGNVDEFTVGKLTILLNRLSSLFNDSPTRLNTIYLYYDFSNIENKYKAYDSFQRINEILNNVAKYDKESYLVEKGSDEWNTLYKDTVAQLHQLSQEIEIQRTVIIEIQKILRNEYKR